MTADRDLADRARQLADRAACGSLERKAYGCAAVALSTTGTLAAARRALGDVGQADVQAAALAVIEQLADGPKSVTTTRKAASVTNLQVHDRQAAIDMLLAETIDVLARALLGEGWREKARSSRSDDWTARTDRPPRVA